MARGSGSLRRRIILPLLAVSGAVSALMAYLLIDRFERELDRQMRIRSELIANAITDVSELVSRASDVQRVVAARAAEPDVELIVAVAGDPAKVIASSRHAWLGRSLDEIGDPGFGDLVSTVEYAGVHRGDEKKHRHTYVTRFDPEPDRVEQAREHGAVLVRMTTAPVRAMIQRTAGSMLGLLLLTLALVTLAAYALIAREVLHPISAMVASVNRREQGDQAARVPLGRTVELSALSIAANRAFEASEAREHQMRSLVANVPGAVFRVPSWTEAPIFVSEAAREVTGYESSELCRRSLGALVHPGDAARIREAHETAAASGAPCRLEYRILARDGSERLVVEHARGSVDAGTGTRMVDGILFDITERRRADEAIRESDRRAREAAELGNRVKSEFLATVSHEIRTPLNAVLGFADLLAESELGAEQAEWVATIRRSGFGLLGLLSDILDVSKIEAGRMVVEITEFALHPLLLETVNTLEARAREKSIDLAVRCDEVDVTIRGDRSRLRQVLFNLIGNAIKFTSQGGRVSVEVRGAHPVRHDTCGRDRTRPPDSLREIRCSAGQAVEISVTDNGIGIEPDAAARLFQPFAQADSSTTRRFGGSGLGLAISKRLVEMMGGQIGFESEVGRGSKFWFTIARGAQGASGSIDVPKSVADLMPDRLEAGGGAPIRVLLAEDNCTNALLAERLLRKLGCTVDRVEDGASAVRLSLERPYAMLLMDCQMPELDGYEATRRIREREDAGSRVPIIALTANAMAGDRARCKECGMDDYLTKPIDRDQLRRVISTYGLRRPS